MVPTPWGGILFPFPKTEYMVIDREMRKSNGLSAGRIVTACMCSYSVLPGQSNSEPVSGSRKQG